MTTPVSVIIPTYNRATFIDAAIRSILSQVQHDDEIIVVDDGSTDHTAEVLTQFGDRVSCIQGQHRGAGRARNLGLCHARCPLIAFLDSDDEWLPGKLCLQRQLMDARPDILYCFSNFQVERRNREIIHGYLDNWPRESRTWEEVFGPGVAYSSIAGLPPGMAEFQVYCGDLYRWQLTGLYVLTDTLLVRRQEAGDALHFAEDLPTYEDLECFFRLSRKGKAAYLDVETARQRDYAGDRLSNLDRLKRVQCRLVLVARIWGQDPAFLAEHGELYRRYEGELRQELIKLYLMSGRQREARAELGRLEDKPLQLKLLASLPARLTHSALLIRQTFKDTLGKRSAGR